MERNEARRREGGEAGKGVKNGGGGMEDGMSRVAVEVQADVVAKRASMLKTSCDRVVVCAPFNCGSQGRTLAISCGCELPATG